MKPRATGPGSELPTIKHLGLSLADRRWELPRKTQRSADFRRKRENEEQPGQADSFTRRPREYHTCKCPADSLSEFQLLHDSLEFTIMTFF